jgi:N-acetylneuraminic acid mutarotase
MTRRKTLAAAVLAAWGKELRMTDLPPLPQPIAGQFVGVHAGRLIVAGGTSWNRPKWDGGEKRWTPAIYTLGPDETSWRESGEQAEPLAYGGAVNTSAGVVCIAGQGPVTASASVYLLFWDGSRVKQRRLVDLPEPRMLLGAAGSGDAIFAVAGQLSPEATTAAATVWELRAADGEWHRARWRVGPPVPGPGRILPAIAPCEGGFYLASGATLFESPLGRSKRKYLADAYRYQQGAGWSTLPTLPAPVVAAPACSDASGRFLIFGGDDGALADQVPEPGPRHPGFRRAILRLESGNWREIASLSEGLVTTGVAQWRGSMVIPGGEDRPGSRSARVLLLQGLI